jgi:hypothetical protein
MRELRTNDNEPPWWLPVDLDRRTMLVAQGMIEAVPEKLRSFKGSRKERQEATVAMLHGIMGQPDFQHQLAMNALAKPLDLMKLAVSLETKNIKIESEHTEKHVIVVPGMTSPEDWNNAHLQRKELADGDWGIDLADTTFIDVESE